MAKVAAAFSMATGVRRSARVPAARNGRQRGVNRSRPAATWKRANCDTRSSRAQSIVATAEARGERRLTIKAAVAG